MLLLAIATSIDALAVGVTYAFLQVQIVPAVSFIGIITFSLSIIGVKIGNVFGLKYKTKAEIAGGVILLLMGTKILLEHLGFPGGASYLSPSSLLSSVYARRSGPTPLASFSTMGSDI